MKQETPSRDLELLSEAAIVLSARLGHTFSHPSLLQAALTHPSWRNEQPAEKKDNQRLEFLGDSVIGLIVARHLYDTLPEQREGVLTVLMSTVVNEAGLAKIAQNIDLGSAIRLGKGERLSGGSQLASVLSDALEAVFGALFLDAGYERSRKIALALFDDSLREAVAKARADGQVHVGVANFKTALQELLQRAHLKPPRYELERRDGPPHDRRFIVRATAAVDDETLEAKGKGRTKKSAENRAAELLYAQIQSTWRATQAQPDVAHDLASSSEDDLEREPTKNKKRDGAAALVPPSDGDPSGI